MFLMISGNGLAEVGILGYFVRQMDNDDITLRELQGRCQDWQINQVVASGGRTFWYWHHYTQAPAQRKV